MPDSLLTLAATELLGLGCLGRGNDHYAFTYVSEVNSMGPFGVEPSVAVEKAKKAAWGTFNWIVQVDWQI
ncbi:hypothetical protein HYE67_000620 [Fusarium culmorum]|uniref:Uncharacterized protein n=1 Tax=Fusarium culmorum TaxID=5516 RepID=A0A2T4GJG2_FUSCU|nr:hypothetical protein FCULG_00002243 [Fusarium culmorum]QPC58389.1 hypothetical protein HYE67_000620 [Fusarium culmorum]